MSPPILFTIAGASVSLAALAGWRGALPPNPLKGPRLMPWRFVMLLSATLAIVALFAGLQAAGIHPPGR